MIDEIVITITYGERTNHLPLSVAQDKLYQLLADMYGHGDKTIIQNEVMGAVSALMQNSVGLTIIPATVEVINRLVWTLDPKSIEELLSYGH